MPEWERAMMRSAPSSFICGTQAFGRLDDVAGHDLAVQIGVSQIMICGGTKPMKPILIGWLCAGAVGDLFFDDEVGLQVEVVLARIGARASCP